MAVKFIFITGGVVSSLGKGITGASLGRLLKCRGLKVVNQKLDPYINVDPGTMSPYQHGEVFVTEDGAETDLDLGHYERFTDENLKKSHSVTSGSVYASVLEKERQGAYLGATVQVIPHITGYIQEKIAEAARDNPDILISEIGGTVGDIEGLPFLEAARQWRRTVGQENCLFIHVTLIPFLNVAGEAKTKPTQHSVKELRSIGIQPDIIVCRSERPLSDDIRAKISLFCNVEKRAVIFNGDAANLYEVPLLLHKENLDSLVCQMLNLDVPPPDLSQWKNMVRNLKNPLYKAEIALVGKYVRLHDAYLSVVEALVHGGTANRIKVNIRWINAEELEKDFSEEKIARELSGVDGVLVPGGFGERGLEGKIAAIKYARENDIPFLGICLGMQMAVVEFCRNVLGLKDANTTEISAGANPVIDIMEEQKNIHEKGGTMRLGAYDCLLMPDSKAFKAYGKTMISERHRHRFEFNNAYRNAVEKAGGKIAGINPRRDLVEIFELSAKRWFVGVQFHPEFKSRPNNPHPLFRDFVAASLSYNEEKKAAKLLAENK
jgi:CTP synthase